MSFSKNNSPEAPDGTGSKIESPADYPNLSHEELDRHGDADEEPSNFPLPSAHDYRELDDDYESDFPIPSAADEGEEEEATFPSQDEIPGKETDAEAGYPAESTPDFDIPVPTCPVEEDCEASHPAPSLNDPVPTKLGRQGPCDEEEAAYPEPSRSTEPRDRYPEDQIDELSEHDERLKRRGSCKNKKPLVEESQLEVKEAKDEEFEEVLREKTKREKEREQKCREELEAWLQLSKDDHLLSYAFDDVNLPRHCQTSTDQFLCRRLCHYLSSNDISRIQHLVRVYDQSKQIQNWISSHHQMNQRIKELRKELHAAKRAAKEASYM